jgi:hypothetical protein
VKTLTEKGPSLVFPPFRFNSLAFVVGILSSQTLYFAGTLKGGEVLAVAYLLFFDKKLGFAKIPAPIIIAALAWALAQLFSDFINVTAISDAIKGVGAPILLLLTLIGMVSFFTRSPSRLPSFLLGLPCGALLDLFLSPSQYFLTSNPWKWGYGGIVGSLALTVYSFIVEPKVRTRDAIGKADFLYLAIVLALAVVSLGNESRSALISPVLFILYLLLKSGRLNNIFNFLNSLSRKSIAVPFIALVLSIGLANIVITSLLQAPFVLSLMPDNIQEKTLEQTSNQLGVLFGGRSEIFASAQAFLDKPLLGHGSWAQDPKGIYTDLLTDRLSDTGQDVNYELLDYLIQNTDGLLIPAHSYIFSALVWSGIVGGMFWLVILSYVLRSLLQNSQILPYYFFAGGYGLIWAIFFSPFGYTARFSSAVFMAALISAIWLARKSYPRILLASQHPVRQVNADAT